MSEEKKEYADLKFDPYVIDDSFEDALTYEKVFGKKQEDLEKDDK